MRSKCSWRHIPTHRRISWTSGRSGPYLDSSPIGPAWSTNPHRSSSCGAVRSCGAHRTATSRPAPSSGTSPRLDARRGWAAGEPWVFGKSKGPSDKNRVDLEGETAGVGKSAVSLLALGSEGEPTRTGGSGRHPRCAAGCGGRRRADPGRVPGWPSDARPDVDREELGSPDFARIRASGPATSQVGPWQR